MAEIEKPEIKIIRDQTQYHESLKGILDDPTKPLPRSETFGIWEASSSEVHKEWLRPGAPYGPNDRHRLMRFNLQVINVGSAPITWANRFDPERLILAQSSLGWFMPFANDYAEVQLLNGEDMVYSQKIKARIIVYPAVLMAIGWEFSQFNLQLDPGFYYDSLPQDGMFIDITDVPDGDYTFRVIFDPNNWTEHTTTEDFRINKNGFDIRKII